MTESEIRRLPDGSIDYRHYTRVARKLHAEAVRDAARLVGARIAALIAVPRETGGNRPGARWKPRYLA